MDESVGAVPFYRDATSGDVPAMAELFHEAVTDMFARNGVQTPIPPLPAVVAAYEHVRRSGVFRVAEVGGRIVGIAGAIVRDNLWHLSAFWLLPQYQNRRIGMPLLRQVWQQGSERGAASFFTWSSVDVTAMAAYLKLGMRPGYPILLFEGTPVVAGSLSPHFRADTLRGGVAEELDQQVRGTRREVDHALWVSSPGGLARQVERDGAVIGYFYAQRGVVGPVAWSSPSDASAVLALAVQAAAAQAPSVRLSVPGINHAALQFVFGTGLRLVGTAHFLTTAPFGQMENYLPSGPSLY